MRQLFGFTRYIALVPVMAVLFMPTTALAGKELDKTVEDYHFRGDRCMFFLKQKNYKRTEEECTKAIDLLHKIGRKCGTRLALRCSKYRAVYGKESIKWSYSWKYHKRAMARYMMNKNAAARADAQKALQYRDQNWDAHYLMGLIEVRAGNRAAAMKHYEKIKKYSTKNADLLIKKINGIR